MKLEGGVTASDIAVLRALVRFAVRTRGLIRKFRAGGQLGVALSVVT